MEILINKQVEKNLTHTNAKKKWWWDLGKKIKSFLLAKADEKKRRNSLDYFLYWYPQILEEDLQKQQEKD